MRGSDDFFRGRIDQMIHLRHPLAVLASHMPWQEIEAALAKQIAQELKKGRTIQEVGLFDSQTVMHGAGLSNAGRPRLPFCLMVWLLYLKHAYNESDEGLVER
jgi:IS5 family transposase